MTRLHFANRSDHRIAAEYGLELVYLKTFHDFYIENLDDDESRRLMYRMYVFDEDGRVPAEDWEAINVYQVFCFEKVERE